MRTKTLREIQQKGAKAISRSEPLILTNRQQGPVGILIPVSLETLPLIQAEAEKWMAMESLKRTWKLAKETGLSDLSDDEIDLEIKKVRRNRASKK